MPIVIIKSVLPTDLNIVTDIGNNIRKLGSQALQCSSDNVWVIFEPLEAKYNDKNSPPVVLIKAQAGRSHEMREAFVKAVATGVGRGLSISPNKVWIHYEEMKPQDIWFEGKWVKGSAGADHQGRGRTAEGLGF